MVAVHSGPSASAASGANDLNISSILLESDLFEASLYLMERELVPLEICQRKYLTREATGVLIQGTLPQLKLIQTIMAKASFTLRSLTKQTQLNLLEHSMTLLTGTHVLKEDLWRVGWTWMTSKRVSALECESFNPHISPKMNILI